MRSRHASQLRPGAIVLGVGLLLAGVGCSSSPTPDGAQPDSTNATEVTEVTSPDVIMRCGDRQYFGNFAGDRLEVTTDDGASYSLPQVESADGVKYSDGTVTLWNKGVDWMHIDETTGDFEECFVAQIGG